jgi:hypothetical protein
VLKQPLVRTCHVWLVVRESKCFFEEITAIWALLPEEAYTQHSIFYLQDNQIKTHKIDGPHRWTLNEMHYIDDNDTNIIKIIFDFL